jgi:hypothetical protein
VHLLYWDYWETTCGFRMQKYFRNKNPASQSANCLLNLHRPVKETPPRKRITVTSSLNEILILRISWEIRWQWQREALNRPNPHPILQQASGQIFKDDVNVLPPPRIFGLHGQTGCFLHCSINSEGLFSPGFHHSCSYILKHTQISTVPSPYKKGTGGVISWGNYEAITRAEMELL